MSYRRRTPSRRRPSWRSSPGRCNGRRLGGAGGNAGEVDSQHGASCSWQLNSGAATPEDQRARTQRDAPRTATIRWALWLSTSLRVTRVKPRLHVYACCHTVQHDGKEHGMNRSRAVEAGWGLLLIALSSLVHSAPQESHAIGSVTIAERYSIKSKVLN
jgi:hypothetical protein